MFGIDQGEQRLAGHVWIAGLLTALRLPRRALLLGFVQEPGRAALERLLLQAEGPPMASQRPV